MKKLIFVVLTVLIVACSDDEGNPCLYNPTLTTSAVTNITETSATLNGVISIVSENCDNPTNTEQGFVYATTIQPTTANNKVNVNGTDISTTLENLEPNTTYYARTFLTNVFGEFYGNEVSFTTSEEQLCEYNLITLEPTNITSNSTILNGTISIDEESCDLPNTEQGFVYSTEVQPTIEDTQVNVNGTDISTTLENLEPNTTYYARTFLTNAFGEFYGNEVNFMTTEEPIDCDVVYLAENGITIKACDDANVGDTGVIDGITYTVVDEAILREMVANEEDVTTVVTTLVTDMSELFRLVDDSPNPNFNQDISSWDVSNVTTMFFMFRKATNFNQPIGNWDVSSVTNMRSVFSWASSFNQPIGNWDVSSVTNMDFMFSGFLAPQAFNQDISNWDVSNVTTMDSMFDFCTSFNQPIGNWDVSNVTNMITMFLYAEAFNQPIGDWNVGNVTNMTYMFGGATSFNQPIGNWDVSNVTNMGSMFSDADAFNQPIGNWDVSNVIGISSMFNEATSFNQPIGDWDVSNVTNMYGMFSYAISYNQDISNWDVSNVTTMGGMFQLASTFNQDISTWDVSNVTFCFWFSQDAPLTEANTPNFTNCTP